MSFVTLEIGFCYNISSWEEKHFLIDITVEDFQARRSYIKLEW